MHQAVGTKVAERIASFVREGLGLDDTEHLRLKAELMGTPDEFVRAYFGTASAAHEALGIGRDAAAQLLMPEGRVTYWVGQKAAESLQEKGAPEAVVREVREKTLLEGVRRRKGAEATIEELRAEPREYARRLSGKPHLQDAVERSGLAQAEIRREAGLSKEAVQNALYKRGGGNAAVALATMFRQKLGLMEHETALVAWDILNPPEEF
jgi:hypothetical protein